MRPSISRRLRENQSVGSVFYEALFYCRMCPEERSKEGMCLIDMTGAESECKRETDCESGAAEPGG